MRIYLDTSAFLAVMNSEDLFHPAARAVWDDILTSNTVLFSTNYVVVETTAILQHCFGVEAVRLFFNEVLPVIEVVWVTEMIHNQAVSALLTANQRHLSLVDCASFEAIRQYRMDAVFAFDDHFVQQGFRVIPEQHGSLSPSSTISS